MCSFIALLRSVLFLLALNSLNVTFATQKPSKCFLFAASLSRYVRVELLLDIARLCTMLSHKMNRRPFMPFYHLKTGTSETTLLSINSTLSSEASPFNLWAVCHLVCRWVDEKRYSTVKMVCVCVCVRVSFKNLLIIRW